MFRDLPPDAITQARWAEQALSSARTHRREAVGDFWRGANAVLGLATDPALRSARRLAARLAHHRQSRQAQGE